MHILNELGQTTAAVHVGTELLRVADGLEAADESPGPLPFAVDWLRASCLTNLGVCHTFAGDYVAAAAATAAAEQHLLALRRQDEIAILRQNQAELLLAEGHAHRARDMFAHAVRGFAETDQLRLHTAEAYLALNLYDEAALIYDQVTALVELSGQAHYHAVALAGRGAALAALQRWDEAGELLQRAAERHDRVGNVPLATASRVELAAVLAHRGDRDAAVDLLRRLRGDTGDDRYRVARVYVLLGLSDVAEPVGASAALVEAADLVHRLGLPPLRFRVDSRLGALRRRQGRLVEARDLLQRAADEADDQRALLPSQLTRTSFLRDKTRTFDELVALHLDLEPDSADAAFLASERAKGRALLDLVSTTATPGAPVAEMLDSAVARVLDDEGLGSVWTTAEAIRWASDRDADVIN
jgi:tetratricopeptide (TPR) repeat protein